MSLNGLKSAARVEQNLPLRHVPRLWNASIIVAVILLVTEASLGSKIPGWNGWGITDCKPCAIDGCVNETNCRGGKTMDSCNCCVKCFKVQGELCGGIAYHVGRCDHSLYCNITGANHWDPVGRCTPVLPKFSGTYVDSRGSTRNTIPHAKDSVSNRHKNVGFYVTHERAYMKIVQNLSESSVQVRSHVNSPSSSTLDLALNSSSSLSKDSVNYPRTRTRIVPAVTYLVASSTLFLCVVLFSYMLEHRSRTAKRSIQV